MVKPLWLTPVKHLATILVMIGSGHKSKNSADLYSAGQPATTVKEARKLLGKNYNFLSDDEVARMVALLDSIARKYIQSTVPQY